MTLAALFAMTAGAWAQTGAKRIAPDPAASGTTLADGTLQVTEIKASDISAWDGDNTTLSAADLPGFKTVTLDEAKAWAEAPSNTVILIYAFDGNDVQYAHFYDGEYYDTYSQSISRGMIYNGTYYGQQFFYTGAPASSEPQTLELTEAVAGKQWTAVMPAGNVVFQVEYDPWKVTLQQTDNGTVEAVTGGGDGVTDNTDGTYSVVPGKSITLKATPAEGYRLAGWYKVDGSNVSEITSGIDDEAGTLTYTPEADVTIRAEFVEQTYTVTFADDTAEPTLWTASPAAGVKKGQTVTVTYTGAKKVIGVKAEKKAAAPASTPLDNTIKAWTAGTYAVPADGLTYSDAITVSGDVTLTLTDGETLTLNSGLSLASGATLTVEGNGTMNVNGTNESTASTVAGTGTLVLTSGTLTVKGGNGGSVGEDEDEVTKSAGGIAINGAVTVSGGTLTATGGNGGAGGSGQESKAGTGAAAISGDVTVSGGTLTATGGNGGSFSGSTLGPDGYAGAGGTAIVGSVTITDGTVTATGGNGGSITISGYAGELYAGNGGAAISGNATVNGGTWTATNGTNGTLGGSGNKIDCSAGTGGKAVAGTVTDNRN